MSEGHQNDSCLPLMIDRQSQAWRRGTSSSALISRFGALVTGAAVAMATSAVSAAGMVREGGLRLPFIQPQHARLLPNKPPPVNGYTGPNGPVCHQVCVGSVGGGNPQRPPACQWQTVCN
jgi:hypothetical protein